MPKSRSAEWRRHCPQLARRAVKNGVDANLAMLKRILEGRPSASNPAG